MKTPGYFDRSAEAVLSLQNQNIGNRGPGTEIGRGGAFVVRNLGSAILGEASTAIAIKSAYTPRGGAYIRLLTDLSFSALIEMRAPEIANRLPLFTSGLTIGNRFEPVAILTEDVSRGGTVSIKQQPISQTAKVCLTNGLSEFGMPEEIFDEEEMHNTLAFNVGGQEKFLDFDPHPFLNVPLRHDLFRLAMELSEDRRFFVDIGNASKLAGTIVH